MKSLEALVFFDHEEFGFSDKEVFSLFPRPISTSYPIMSEAEARGLSSLVQYDPFYTAFEDLIDFNVTTSKTKNIAAGVEVFSDEMINTPEFRIIRLTQPPTPTFEF